MELPTTHAESMRPFTFHSIPSPAVRFFWLYPLLVALSEVLAQLLGLRLALIVHMLLLLALAFPRAVAQRQIEQDLTLALLLAPLPRLLALVLPLDRFPQTAWYGMVAMPTLVAAWLVAQQLKILPARQAYSMRKLAFQMLVALGGVAIGAAMYVIQPAESSADIGSPLIVVIGSLVLAFCSGALDEVIFRGVLQKAAYPILGRWTVVYIVLLLASLQVGLIAPSMIILWAGVGLLFGIVARQSGSVLGVVFAHGLANATMLIIMPLLARTTSPQIAMIVPWVIGSSALSLLCTLGVLVYKADMLRIAGKKRGALATCYADIARNPFGAWLMTMWTQPAPKARPPRPIARTIRALRLQNGVKYIDLAQRTGLSVRLLAEIEHGMRLPHPDQIDKIANGLGIPPHTIRRDG